MVRFTVAFACSTLALFLAPVHAQQGASTPEAAPTIKVETRLVMVPVIVRDKKGQLVKDLKQTDFTLSENNKPQTIKYFDKDSEAPLTVGLLIDVSGSQRNVLDGEQTASSAFLDTLLRPGKDKAFLVQFGHQADLLADVTGSLPKLEAGLKKVDADADRPQFSQTSQDPQDPNSGSGNSQGNGSSNGGYGGRGGHRGGNGSGYRGTGTVLYDAIYLSSNEVIGKQPQAAKNNDRKALILLTDGDDRGSKESISSATEAAQRTNATVYAIYFKGEEHNGGGGGFPGGGRHGGMGGGFPGMGGGGWPGSGGGGRGGNGGGGQGRGGEQHVDGKKILERICDETGGRVFEVSKKEPVDDIYKQISEELRSEYRLGFTPSDTSDGYHHLLVDLSNDKKSTVQARDGYYIGAATE